MFKWKKKKDTYKSTFQEFEYTIENVTTDRTFREQCARLKNEMYELIDDGIIEDEDGTKSQYYLYKGMEITVMYETELQEVYVSSPIDLSEFIVESCG